jgi:hypothetical protein
VLPSDIDVAGIDLAGIDVAGIDLAEPEEASWRISGSG